MRKPLGQSVSDSVREILDHPLPPGYVPEPPPVDPNDPESQFVHDLWWEMMCPTPPPPVTITSMALDVLEQQIHNEEAEKKTAESGK